MKSYVKVFAPVLLAILIGSLTFIFAQTERGDVGKSQKGAKKEVGVASFGEEGKRIFSSSPKFADNESFRPKLPNGGGKFGIAAAPALQ